MVEASLRQAFESSIRQSLERGDHEGATNAVLRGYGPEIYSYLASSRRASDDADEVFSLFAEGVWRGLPGFEWQSSLRNWAYSIARRSLLRYRRDAGRRGRRQEAMPERASVLDVAAEVRSATAVHLRSEVKDRMAELRESLAPEDRELLLLRVDRGLSWADLARIFQGEEAPPLEGEALKRDAARLRKRFQTLKERLRELARREGLIDEGQD